MTLDFIIGLIIQVSTLVYLLNAHDHLIIFRKMVGLCGLNRYCSLNYFCENFQPVHLLDTVHLIIFRKNSRLCAKIENIMLFKQLFFNFSPNLTHYWLSGWHFLLNSVTVITKILQKNLKLHIFKKWFWPLLLIDPVRLR